MTKLTDLIGARKPDRADWFQLADHWGVNSDYHLAALKPKGVKCGVCWDWDVCAECLGEYPDHCPAFCGDGTCTGYKGEGH